MKTLFFAVLIFACTGAGAQEKKPYTKEAAIAAAAAAKKDTVVVPVFEATDTVAVAYTYVENDFVKIERQGFAVLKGYTDKPEKTKDRRWMAQPKVAAILNRNKQPAKDVLELLE